MKLFVPVLMAAVAAGTASATQVRVHVHNKLYITPAGGQCAYDETKDASMYPCQSGECVRINSTYGKCMSKEEASKYKTTAVKPSGKDNKDEDDSEESYDEYDDEDSEEYDEDDSEEDDRKHRHHEKAVQKAHHGKKARAHKKLYITPMGQQCAYDETKDASMYPCQGGGECVRLNSTYGKCMTKEEASKYKTTIVKPSDMDDNDDDESEESYDEYDDDDSDVYDSDDSEEDDRKRRHHKKAHHGKKARVHKKLYITPAGGQCAYDETKDASMYPCQSGECVRINSTYGKCMSKEEASKYKSTGAPVPVGSGKPAGKEDRDGDSEESYDDDDDEYIDVYDEDSVKIARKRHHSAKGGHKKHAKHIDSDDSDSFDSIDDEDVDSIDFSKKHGKAKRRSNQHKKLRHGKQSEDDSDDDSDSEDLPVCELDCPDNQWCERGTNFCRKTNHKTQECFNELTQLFENGKSNEDGSCV